MKHTIKNTIGLGILSLLFGCFVGCKDALEAPLEFAVVLSSVDPTVTFEQVDDTTFSAQVGQVVNFSFEGNADFITLKYNCFNEADASLTFDQKVTMFPNNGNVKLFLSTSPLVLQKNNAKADSALIRDHEWIDLSNQVTWAQEQDEATSTSIDMKEYRGQSIILAFCYNTLETGIKQPMFTLSNLQMNYRTVKDQKVFKTVAASTMGFQPFDMVVMDDSVSYHSTDPDEMKIGCWDCSFKNEDKTAIIMRQGMMGSKTPNEDWIFTNPIYISRGKDDEVKTAVIKNYYLAAEDYQFTLEDTGEYTISFLATCANYKQNVRTTKTFKFIVHE
ncbi:MAG: DUF5017 domain-containing protein [Paludibacteraceae bacterium]